MEASDKQPKSADEYVKEGHKRPAQPSQKVPTKEEVKIAETKIKEQAEREKRSH